MKIGYGRVSTQDQNLDLQVDALKAAGCDRIYLEKFTGTKKSRPELNKMFDQLRPGDTVVVWRLDRLGRSVKDNIDLVLDLKEKQCGIVCLMQPIDTTSANGMLIFNIFSALAEAEHQNIVERTNAGLAAARARGRTGGRPKGLSKKAALVADNVAILYEAGNSIRKIMEMTGINSSKTIYRYIRHKGIPISDDEKKAAEVKKVAAPPLFKTII